MKQILRKPGLYVLIIFIIGCTEEPPPQEPFKIAFMADVHFHDVFASFEDDGFRRLPITYEGKNRRAVIRTMKAQLNSTRLFNENYFAFIAALDDAVNRGIKFIVLPGDFSDDGQPVHVRGLVNVLKKYEEKYGLTFFTITGNHDPVRPFVRKAGKSDFLGSNGRPQPIFSKRHSLCNQDSRDAVQRNSSTQPTPNPVICTDKIRNLGYKGLFRLLKPYGMYPKETDIHYETPFAQYSRNKDSYELKKDKFGLSNRRYEICSEGSGGAFKQSYYTNCQQVVDMSYLIEPVRGIWLLAIDANVYVPEKGAKGQLSSPSDAGYNKIVTHKKHLLEWIEDVASRAENQDKKLIAFSHYPAVDFYNGAQPEIESLWGENQFQLERVPRENTSQLLARTGIRFHVAGHMHMNSTAVVRDSLSDNVLTNIQVPSLAGYVPAYKVVNISGHSDNIEVETVVLDEVPGFDTFFPQYEKEWKYLDSLNYKGIWDRRILTASNYHEYMDWHMRELSRLRFLPNEWPRDIRALLAGLSGRDMLIASFLQSPLTFDQYQLWLKEDGDGGEISNITSAFANDWSKAKDQAATFAQEAGIRLSELAQWNGRDLSVDFYRLRNAGELALRDTPTTRIAQYALIAEALSKSGMQIIDYDTGKRLFAPLYKQKFKRIFNVMRLFSNRLASDHFRINVKTGEIKNLTTRKPIQDSQRSMLNYNK